MSVRAEIKQQKSANKASLKYDQYFAEHRRRQTDLILAHNPHGGRICILGAGNCMDVDLPRISEVFAEIHLVDIDREALEGAKRRLPATVARKIHLHTPVDVSGANKTLEDWRNFKVTEEVLLEFPARAADEIKARLPGPFDCVVSSCLISQILLTCTRVLGEEHPLLQAGLITLLVAHLRLLAALTKPQRNALWITDVSSSEIAPLPPPGSQVDGAVLLQTLAATNRLFTYLQPNLITDLARQDPQVSASGDFADPPETWLWHNGPHRSFLVYALIFSAGNGPNDSA
ncbi:MAG: hypothetical protein NVV73_01735 [Cellvibrionaceae bacterium]|nr:hypothetical protein [Cellvibrionaceae bacterium]